MEYIITKRKDNEPPFAVESLGWKYHHMGIPTRQSMPEEKYIPHLKMYVSGFETSPFGIEWMRFDEGSPVSELVRTIPHIAFEVSNIDEALKEYHFELISEPGVPSEGVRAAMIKHNGAPVELIEFNREKQKL